MLSFTGRVRCLARTTEGARHLHRTPNVSKKNAARSNVMNLDLESTTEARTAGGPGCPTFKSWIDGRRKEAKRSLLVQVKSSESATELLNYCYTTYGPVCRMDFHNNPQNKDFPNFFIVEFDNEESVREALTQGGHTSMQQGHLSIPVTSPFMWFCGKDQQTGVRPLKDPPPLDVPIYVPTPQQKDRSEAGLETAMAEQATMDKQMVALYQFQKLSSLETKLRFLACQQLELALSGLFPQAEVIPFGSSVNQFGAHTTDLDMMVNFSKETADSIQASRLQFHTKVDHGSGSRSLSRTYCNEIASLVEHFLPGCQDVLRITRARVPIFSYRQSFIGVDVDVCFDTSGIFMSELLFLFGELDSRVRPLVFNVREWAKEQGLISNVRPTRHFKNFQITLLVLFFLQNKYGMLPSINEMKKRARPEDKMTANNVDGTFIRDISGLQPLLNRQWYSQPHVTHEAEGGQPKTLTLVQMLADFFEFYALFDFGAHRLCLVTGDLQPRHKAQEVIQVGNPLVAGLNATDNLSKEVVAHFQDSCSVGLRRLFALNELSDKARLKNSKLSYVISSADPDITLSKIYGQQSKSQASQELNQKLNTVKFKIDGKSSTHRQRRQQEMARQKFFKVPKLQDILTKS